MERTREHVVVREPVRGVLGQVCADEERRQVAPACVRFAGRAARVSVSRVRYPCGSSD
jgi:hypothetical protein